MSLYSSWGRDITACCAGDKETFKMGHKWRMIATRGLLRRAHIFFNQHHSLVPTSLLRLCDSLQEDNARDDVPHSMLGWSGVEVQWYVKGACFKGLRHHGASNAVMDWVIALCQVIMRCCLLTASACSCWGTMGALWSWKPANYLLWNHCPSAGWLAGVGRHHAISHASDSVPI